MNFSTCDYASWFSDESDLNLTISKENFVAGQPIHDQGLMYMWAGAKSTYGFNSGKIYYEVKVIYSITPLFGLIRSVQELWGASAETCLVPIFHVGTLTFPSRWMLSKVNYLTYSMCRKPTCDASQKGSKR